MTRARFARLGLLLAAGWCGCELLSLGCAASTEPAGECVAAQTAPLYFGSEEPLALTLSAGERAAIGLVTPYVPTVACTGVMLASGHVLTAAHCDTGVALRFRPSLPDAEPIAVLSSNAHPELDVMLLKLDLHHGAGAITPIGLWPGLIDQSWVGTEVTLAGLGETEVGLLGELRFANEPVVEVNALEISVDGMGQSGACIGDSGGPLLVATTDGDAAIAGVLDRGSRDCLGRDVYLRADRIREWIGRATGASCAQAGSR